MTEDAHFFRKRDGRNLANGELPLYEGKMIHHFDHRFGEPRYWLNEKKSRKAVIGRGGIEQGQELPYEKYRLAFVCISLHRQQ